MKEAEGTQRPGCQYAGLHVICPALYADKAVS